MKIVYVDDHKLFQEGVQRCIDPDKEKFFIQKFHYSEDALRYIENTLEEGMKIDLVMTDFNHLQMNGYEFSKKVRELDKKYNITTPILLLTMIPKNGNPLVELGVETGVFDIYLTKDKEGDEINAAIDILLKRNHL